MAAVVVGVVSMPSYRGTQTAVHRRWHARAKRDGVEFSLGYYVTLDEALRAEERFNQDNPRRCNQRGKHQRPS